MRARLFLTGCFILLAFLAKAELRMPGIFSDAMVLQRNKPVLIWGWASPGETVEVRLKDQHQKTKASKEGTWQISLKALEHGGPYQMTVKGKKETFTFSDILVGDVWLCSGQSNMEWRVNGVNRAESEISAADYPLLRMFTVPQKVSNRPETELEGSWEVCSPETVGQFSAVAYFFGREILRETGVPIGLINSSWGGTDIETWTSQERMMAVPSYKEKLETSSKLNLDSFQTDNQRRKEKFNTALREDIGIKEAWYRQPEKFRKQIQVPLEWERSELAGMDGSAWFSTSFILPEGWDGKQGLLSLGTIDDDDITWINGVKIGETAGYSTKRIYTIPEGVLKADKNVLTVNVKDYQGGGGINGAPESLFLESGNIRIFLSGTWKYEVSVDSREFGLVDFGPNAFPSLLYNAMIHPLLRYPIKGAIWYQGENNTRDPLLYQTLFPNMINDWRERWGYEFPFYWVQLANFMAAKPQPSESSWAELREAQTLTLSLPQTGQAVIIDIGEAEDIHPRNKQDVGKRLALLALKNDYGQTDRIASGPVFQQAEIRGDQVIVSFSGLGSGLIAKDKYGYVKGFTIAGEDKQFHWAKARISGDQVVVYHEAVSRPKYIRYAWADNPDDANLYNKEGLPACPFRMD